MTKTSLLIFCLWFAGKASATHVPGSDYSSIITGKLREKISPQKRPLNPERWIVAKRDDLLAPGLLPGLARLIGILQCTATTPGMHSRQQEKVF